MRLPLRLKATTRSSQISRTSGGSWRMSNSRRKPAMARRASETGQPRPLAAAGRVATHQKLVKDLSGNRRLVAALDDLLNGGLADGAPRRRWTGQVHQDICVQQDHGHQSYIESRRVASKGMGGLDGRLAIHSRSHAIFAAAAS